MDRFYVTTPIYYASAPPHLGHAYSTVAADVLARYSRQQELKVWFLTGTDEHGAKIADAARRSKKDPEEFVDAQSKSYQHAWRELDITNDDFIRTTEPRHKRAVNMFMNALKESGTLYEGTYRGLYCTGHEAFIKESELINGVCREHQTAPDAVEEQNWFFKLSQYKDALTHLIQNNEMRIVPEARKHEVLGFLSGALEDIAISRPNVKWGIPLPWDANQTVYVWVDALINYISAIGYNDQIQNSKFKIPNSSRWRFWPADLHLIGKDILRFHAVIWPALLMAVKLQVPRTLLVNGYFTIDGKKMSKTVGNVLDPIELARTLGPDAVRYFLLREIPFGEDGDVSKDKLELRYVADLANTLGNLLQRLEKMLTQYCGGKIPNPSQKPQFDLSEVNGLIGKFEFHTALASIWEALQWGNQTIDAHKPWELATHVHTSKEWHQLETVLSSVAVQLLKVSEKLEPFMPSTARAISDRLTARKITPGKPLFPKLPTNQ